MRNKKEMLTSWLFIPFHREAITAAMLATFGNLV